MVFREVARASGVTMVHGHERIDNEPCIMLTGLEDVQKEVVATVISVIGRIHVVPLLVVDRNLHFWRIAVVHVATTLKIFLAVEILRIVHVRIVIKAVPVGRTVRSAPCAAISSLFG